MTYGLNLETPNGYVQIDEHTPHFVCTEFRGITQTAGTKQTVTSARKLHAEDTPAVIVKDGLVGNVRYQYDGYNTLNEKQLYFDTISLGIGTGQAAAYRLKPTDNAIFLGTNKYGLMLWNAQNQVIYNSGTHPANIVDIITPPEMRLTWSDYGSTNNISGLTGSGWIDYTSTIRSIIPSGSSSNPNYWWYAAAYPLPAGTNAVMANWGHTAMAFGSEPATWSTTEGYVMYEKVKEAFVGVHNGYLVVACAMPFNHWVYPVTYDGNYDSQNTWVRCLLNFFGDLVVCKV